MTTESARTVIGGRDLAPVEAAPEADGGFVVVFAAGVGLGFGFGAGVVGAVTAGAEVDGAAWAGVDAAAGGGMLCASAVMEETA